MIIGPTNPEFVTALHLRENDASASWIWDHLDLGLLGGTSQIYVNVFPGSISSPGFSVAFIPWL